MTLRRFYENGTRSREAEDSVRGESETGSVAFSFEPGIVINVIYVLADD